MKTLFGKNVHLLLVALVAGMNLSCDSSSANKPFYSTSLSMRMLTKPGVSALDVMKVEVFEIASQKRPFPSESGLRRDAIKIKELAGSDEIAGFMEAFQAVVFERERLPERYREEKNWHILIWLKQDPEVPAYLIVTRIRDLEGKNLDMITYEVDIGSVRIARPVSALN
jgi:hypothetical protein